MSRFVSAGTDEDPSAHDEAWLKAQQEIEAKRREKAEAGKHEGGKSLYETLQANKAAKQEAFEESVRLKNQFRSLDEDEVEFLDSVLESTRAKEAEVKKETTQQLDAFRRLQEEAEKAAAPADESEVLEPDAWKAGPRKRKKGREPAVGGVKLRRVSTAEKESVTANAVSDVPEKAQHSPTSESEEPATESNRSPERVSLANLKSLDEPAPKPPSPPTTGLGLVAYSSDEDEDEDD